MQSPTYFLFYFSPSLPNFFSLRPPAFASARVRFLSFGWSLEWELDFADFESTFAFLLTLFIMIVLCLLSLLAPSTFSVIFASAADLEESRG